MLQARQTFEEASNRHQVRCFGVTHARHIRMLLVTRERGKWQSRLLVVNAATMAVDDTLLSFHLRRHAAQQLQESWLQ